MLQKNGLAKQRSIMLSGAVLSVAACSDLVVEGAVHTREREDQSTKSNRKHTDHLLYHKYSQDLTLISEWDR